MSMSRLSLLLSLSLVGVCLQGQTSTSITISTTAQGARFQVDGTTYYAAVTFVWPEGSTHYLVFVTDPPTGGETSTLVQTSVDGSTQYAFTDGRITMDWCSRQRSQFRPSQRIPPSPASRHKSRYPIASALGTSRPVILPTRSLHPLAGRPELSPQANPAQAWCTSARSVTGRRSRPMFQRTMLSL